MRVEVVQVASGEVGELGQRADAVTWPSAHRQIGSGVPQYRSRDSAQSMLLSSQSP